MKVRATCVCVGVRERFGECMDLMGPVSTEHITIIGLVTKTILPAGMPLMILDSWTLIYAITTQSILLHS